MCCHTKLLRLSKLGIHYSHNFQSILIQTHIWLSEICSEVFWNKARTRILYHERKFSLPLFIALFSRSWKKAEIGSSPSNSNSVLSKISPLQQSADILQPRAIALQLLICADFAQQAASHLPWDQLTQTTPGVSLKSLKSLKLLLNTVKIGLMFNTSRLASSLASFKMHKYSGKNALFCLKMSKNNKEAT